MVSTSDFDSDGSGSSPFTPANMLPSSNWSRKLDSQSSNVGSSPAGSTICSHLLNGIGDRPFKAGMPVRVRLGVPISNMEGLLCQGDLPVKGREKL